MATTIENLYVGDGTTALYSFTFPYIEVRDVYVSIDDVVQTILTEYTLANATTIEFTTAPAVGANIRIYRDTDTTDVKSVFYPGSAIRAQDLNDNFTQNLYVTQEAIFGSNTATADAAAAAASAEEASTAASTAQASAAQAESDATDAAALAATANTNASAAVVTAGAAQADADAAELTANQALAAVLEVVPYQIVANVAAIPATGTDQEGIRATDSTGIESFTPLTDLPAGFVGDPGIYVDVIWNDSGSTWQYVRYAANDPDDRYAGGLAALPTTGGTMTGLIVFASGQDFPNINDLPALP